MTDHEKALEAAKVIREYCDSIPDGSCKECMFLIEGYLWGNMCVFKVASNPPCNWNLSEAERKCHGNGKSN